MGSIPAREDRGMWLLLQRIARTGQALPYRVGGPQAGTRNGARYGALSQVRSLYKARRRRALPWCMFLGKDEPRNAVRRACHTFVDRGQLMHH